MTSGAKRPATFSDSPYDAEFPSKRVTDTPSDAHSPGPSVDVRRANAAYEHVRALNTQFASWIQLKLQNHQDELWVDDVKDYICHASSIMEKFKDVVDWLRANDSSLNNMSKEATNNAKSLVAEAEGQKQESGPVADTGIGKQTTIDSNSNIQNFSSQGSGLFSFSQQPSFSGFASDKKKLGVFSDDKPNLFQEVTNGVEKQATPASISLFQSMSSQGSGPFSFSQKPAFFGSRGDTTLKGETPGNAEEDDEPEPPSSPSLKKTEEKGVVLVYEVKCKVYRKPDDPAETGWKDIGMGQLSIKCKEGAEKASKDSRPTIIVRNDVGKILLNALIYPGIKMNLQKNTVASIFHTSGGGLGEVGNSDVVSRMHLLKLKNEEEAQKLASAIKEYAPSE